MNLGYQRSSSKVERRRPQRDRRNFGSQGRQCVMALEIGLYVVISIVDAELIMDAMCVDISVATQRIMP